MPNIRLDNITVQLGERQVIKPLSLQIPDRQFVVFIGRSGSGKSSLLNHLYDVLNPHHNVALIPQDLGLVENLSAYHNVYMSRLEQHSSFYNLINLISPRKNDIKPIKKLLNQLNLEDKCWQPAGELSGGQQQRVAIARALHQHGDMLIADEPVSALDEPKACQVMEQLSKQYPSALIALHDLDLALRYGQRIIGIDDGQIALDEPAHRLSQQSLMAFY